MGKEICRQELDRFFPEKKPHEENNPFLKGEGHED